MTWLLYLTVCTALGCSWVPAYQVDPGIGHVFDNPMSCIATGSVMAVKHDTKFRCVSLDTSSEKDLKVPDQLLVSMDLSGAEAFAVGYLAREPRMIEIHQTKGNFHTRTAHYMTGLDEDLINHEDKTLGKETSPERLMAKRRELFPEILAAKWYPVVLTIRQAGKKSGLAFNYDMQYRRFSLENMIPENEGKQMEHLYKYIAYPGLTSFYYPSIQQELFGGEDCADCHTFRYAYLSNGRLWEPLSNKLPIRPDKCQICGGSKWIQHPARILRNCFGRQVRLLGGYGPDLYQQGYSYKPQSSVADSVIQGACDFYEADNPAYQKAYIWTTTHDELTIQYPVEPDLTDLAVTILALSQKYLRPVLRYPPHEFQLDIDTKIGFRYGDPSGDDKADGLISLKYAEPTIECVTEALKVALEKLRSAV